MLILSLQFFFLLIFLLAGSPYTLAHKYTFYILSDTLTQIFYMHQIYQLDLDNVKSFIECMKCSFMQ